MPSCHRGKSAQPWCSMSLRREAWPAVWPQTSLVARYSVVLSYTISVVGFLRRLVAPYARHEGVPTSVLWDGVVVRTPHLGVTGAMARSFGGSWSLVPNPRPFPQTSGEEGDPPKGQARRSIRPGRRARRDFPSLPRRGPGPLLRGRARWSSFPFHEAGPVWFLGCYGAIGPSSPRPAIGFPPSIDLAEGP
jgi:hypothetical protein